MAREKLTDQNRDEVAEFIVRHWQSRMILSRGRQFYPHQGQGLIERREGQIVGLLTYSMEDDGMEILTLNSTIAGQGIGSSLMLDVIENARKSNCERIVLTTTNDKLRAVSFYQRLGFRMVAINLGAVDRGREIKPEIPKTGEGGIPIRDEIVMELLVEPYLDI